MGFSQEILVVENVKSLRNLKYYQGDDIILKVENMEGKVFDEIFDMTDSTIVLYDRGVVELESITGIYRENWLIQTIRGLSLLGGIAYFGIDSFNRLINNDSPVILAETAIISGSLVALSFALTPLKYRKVNTKGNWSLRTIDLNSY
jgi:hypothetical protein